MSDKPVYQRHTQYDEWQDITEEEFERDSLRSKYKTRILYPASAVEAQAKRIAELEQKEIVLDRLIARVDGKPEFVGTKMVHKELPRVSQISLNEESVCVERVNVYQWVFRADGEPSFKQAVMNLLTASKNGDSK